MRVFHGFDNLPPFENPIVTVGSYDGVHLGHRELLAAICDAARRSAGESIVITFSPHPREVLESGNVKLLTTLDEKIMLLDKAGIDNTIVAPFTRKFSEVTSYDFVRDYLIGKVNATSLVVGYNHNFGRNKEGNYDYLYRLRDEFGLEILMIPRQEVDREKVSSTHIRDLIGQGQMDKAAEFLGYRYFFFGISGEDKTLFSADRSKLLPLAGTYKVETATGDVKQSNILSISPVGDLSLDKKPGLETGDILTITF